MRLTSIALLGLVLAPAAAPASTPEDALTPVQVVQLAQSALAVMGEDPGPVDGVLGPQTRAALTAFVDASGLEMGWNGGGLDQGQAMSLNVAAAPALARAFGHEIDGQYGYIGMFPLSVEATEPGVAGGVDCAAAPDQVAHIRGLIVYEPNRSPAVVTPAPPALEPLPRTGTWHPEAEPWRLVILSPDVIAFQQEGDSYVYGRCQP